MTKILKQDTWRNLNAQIPNMSEKELEALLKKELKAKVKRPNFIGRIHSRFNKLRADRERNEHMDVIYNGSKPATKKG